MLGVFEKQPESQYGWPGVCARREEMKIEILGKESVFYSSHSRKKTCVSLHARKADRWTPSPPSCPRPWSGSFYWKMSFLFLLRSERASGKNGGPTVVPKKCHQVATLGCISNLWVIDCIGVGRKRHQITRRACWSTDCWTPPSECVICRSGVGP